MSKQLEKIKSLNVKLTTVTHCPKCGSDKVWRIQRSVPEKIIYHLSHKKYAAKKYQCSSCNYTFFMHSDNMIPEAIAMALVTGAEPLLACKTCERETMLVSSIEPADLIAHKSSEGKTPFRKLKCLHCGAESILYQEDYEESNGNEI